jgi:CubicO group peptidase (beta-lactamase class C family)
MTIRHLLSHTSGIGYGWSNPIANALIAKTKKNEWELPLLHDPGARFTYSAGPRVLGFIIEKLTGCDLESWYQEHIFKPLGMFDTSYVVATDKRRRLAPLFTRVSGKIEPLAGKSVQTPTTGLMRGDGGLYSTAGDYGRFLRMLLNGGALDGRRILRESSVTQMSQNAIGDLHVELQPDADPRFTRPFPRGAGKDKFGLGFQIAAAMDGVRSPGTISWAGLYNTQFWVDPEKQFGAVHMMQLLPFYDDGALRALRGFEQAIYDNVRLA